MKTSILLAILNALVASSYPLPKYNKLDVICPPGSTSASDCYPQVFVPTHEWQTIKEGQDIPPGLHVRMNVFTNEREAKLLDPEGQEGDKEDGQKNNGEPKHYISDIVVVPEGGNDDDNDVSAGGLKLKQHKAYSGGEKYHRQLPGGDLGVSLKRIEEIVSLKHHSKEALQDILESLDIVSELSHDLEYGIQISEYIHPILQLSGLANELEEDFQLNIDKFGDFEILRTALSVLASTMRNNPIAQANVMSYYQYEFDKYLGLILRELRKNSVSSPVTNAKDKDVVLKRYLNLLGVSFRMNYNLKHTFEVLQSFDEIDGEESLMLLFSDATVGEQVKETIALVLKDYQDAFQNFQLGHKKEVSMEKRDGTATPDTADGGDHVYEEEEEEEDGGADDNYIAAFAKMVQKKLTKTSLVSDKRARTLLDNLARLKLDNPYVFKVDEEFLNWVYAQSELVKTHIIKRDLKSLGGDIEDDLSIDDGYHHRLLELRHDVFGNRFGLRKAFADEL